MASVAALGYLRLLCKTSRKLNFLSLWIEAEAKLFLLFHSSLGVTYVFWREKHVKSGWEEGNSEKVKKSDLLPQS